jgi:hypothetical protein
VIAELLLRCGHRSANDCTITVVLEAIYGSSPALIFLTVVSEAISSILIYVVAQKRK